MWRTRAANGEVLRQSADDVLPDEPLLDDPLVEPDDESDEDVVDGVDELVEFDEPDELELDVLLDDLLSVL